MKRIYCKKYTDRVFVMFLGIVVASLLLSCDNKVEVPIPTIEMHNGYTYQLTNFSNGDNLESDNNAVATISSSGLITARGAGNAIIYTTSSKGKQEVKCYLEVHPRRNLLFYIGADERLIDSDATPKINQIRQGWQPYKGEMLIYIDPLGNDGAYLLQVNDVIDANGYYGLDTLHYAEENSANANVLSRVINTMVQNYPADSYGMLFFSHASGWLPEGMLSNPRSLVIDKNNNGETNSEMEYDDFAAAIPDKQFDFIIMEACLMADVMSMYELRNKAEYILASSAEIVSPGFGGNNNGIITETYKTEIMRLYDTKSEIKTIVSEFGQSYYDHIAALSSSNLRSATLSLVKMDEMESLASVMKVLLQEMKFDEANLNVNEVQHFDPTASPRRTRYFDLRHAMGGLISESQMKNFDDQMGKTVVWKAATESFLINQSGGYYLTYHSGLTTYITQSRYPIINAAYRASSWYKAIQ